MSKSTVVVSAPGKIHLMGEHAVVYGKPALLTAVSRRLTVTISPSKSGLTIDTTEPSDYVRQMYQIFCQKYDGVDAEGVSIHIQSDIPAGYHLGSSAATAVALMGALLFFFKKQWNPAIINQLAYDAEKMQHGNPSGGDNTICTYGGLIWYRKETEFLRSIWQLPFRIPETLDRLYLVDTGRPEESTGDMIKLVAELQAQNPELLTRLLEENETQTKRMATAIKDGNFEVLLDTIRRGEVTLESMGVVSQFVISCIRDFESAGGGAKILGGGGRASGVGFLLACHSDDGKAREIAARYGYPIEKITTGGDGVLLESGKGI